MKEERAELSHVEDSLDRRQREAEQAAEKRIAKAAAALSAKARRRPPAGSRRRSSKELRGLALEKARLRLALETLPDDRPRPGGLETGAFLFAPNPGEPEKPLEKIASGGELSRLQLAIRSVASGGRGRGRTLVFDEVDAGIGGRVAEVVGRKLRALADTSRSCASRTFRRSPRSRARSSAPRSARSAAGPSHPSGCSTARERVGEIARMLAGEKVPETALKHARTSPRGGPVSRIPARYSRSIALSRHRRRRGRSGSAVSRSSSSAWAPSAPRRPRRRSARASDG